MSSLDKLAIRGIRSFDHNELSVIQFYNPLTVIVGHNGSGKTTIIECLKYATTGDLPPNTKGGAFVHDPNIAGTSEVKAQVKLRFNNTNKQKMLVERRLQVSKRGKSVSGLTMKTLESTLSFVGDDKDPKKRTSLSTKCANLDTEVPARLGVSKAILDNVIFCHQEESNWPLSEPAALKKKFDDIFEATKYTKALDQIKTLRKEQTSEIKVDKEKLAALKTDRDRAVKLRKAMEEVERSIELKTAENDKLEEEIALLVQQNKTFFNSAAKYQDIIGKAETLRERRNLVEDNLAQVQATLIELSESDSELTLKIDNHQMDLQSAQTEREGYKQKLEDENDLLAGQEKKRSQAQTQHGRLEAMKQRYLEVLESRQTLVRELSEKHSIPGFDHDLSEDEIRDFEERLEEAVVAQSSKIAKIKSEAQAAEQERYDRIQALKSEQAGDERAKRSTVDQIRACNTRIARLNREIESSTTTVADITYKEATLAEDTRRKHELEAAVQEANYPEQIRLKNKETKELEEKREALHVELAGLNAQANARAKLQLKRSENSKKEVAIQSLLDKSAATFRRFCKAEPSRETMEADTNAALQTLETDLAAAERSNRDASRELQAIETSVNISKRNLRDLTAQAQAQRKKVQDGLKLVDTDKASVADAIAEAEEEVEAQREEVTNTEGFARFYEQILKRGQAKHVCIGCNRKLEDDYMGDFVTHVKRQQERHPGKLQEAKDTLASWEKQLEDLKRLLPAELALAKITQEDIPTGEKEVEDTNAKLAPATNRAEETSTRLTEIKEEIREVQMLRRTAADVLRMHRECEDTARDIAKLEAELSATGSAVTTEEIQAQLTRLSEQLRSNKTDVEKVRSTQQGQMTTIQSLSNSIHSNEMALAKQRQDLKDREQLEQQKASEKETIATLDTQLKDLDQKLEKASQPIRQLEDELSQLRSDFTQQEKLASAELQNHNKSVDRIDTVKREIKQYQSRDTEAQLNKAERDLKQLEAVIVDTKSRIVAMQTRIAQTDKKLADSNAVLRNLQDNLRLRRERKNLASIDNELEGLDEAGARKAYREFETKYNDQRQRQTDKQAKQARTAGEVETLKTDLKSKQAELKEEYFDIDKRYKIELIRVKTTEAANEDLAKYAKALDAAIMRFHSLKMEEINTTIRDLWQKTYQGTDIDKIEIKSDAEAKISGVKSSYNYRVVMWKDETEMDMRGRCSAGQKVLASIIIRLALAESFGINCGVMALDEPTTNLDRENIESLAGSLADIIKERKTQSNFQLIVITHDESFLEILGSSGTLDKYWRVSRGDSGQVSRIERQRLN